MTGVDRTDAKSISEKGKHPRLNRGMFTSVTAEWETPREFFDAVNADTHLWHDYVIAHAEMIRFIRGRLRFSGRGPAPFPSALVVFGHFDRKKEMDIP